MGSYALSTLARLFLHISSTFTRLFLHNSLLYHESLNHLSFLECLIQLIPLPPSQTCPIWHKATAQSGVTSSDSSAGSFVRHLNRKFSVIKLFYGCLPSSSRHTSFLHAAHAIYVEFPPRFITMKHRCLSCFDILGLVCWVLWHINPCRLFNTKSIFM